MDAVTTVAAVVAPTLTAVGAAIRFAWAEWRKDRDVTVQTLQAAIASQTEREKAVAVSLDRSTRALEDNVQAMERMCLPTCPGCGYDLRPAPQPTGQHRVGGGSA